VDQDLRHTNLEDARFAAECGADAVGFVFAPSPRRVEADQVRQISRAAHRLEKYGVFVDADSTKLCQPLNVWSNRRAAPSLSGRKCTPSPSPTFCRPHHILQVLNYKALEFEQQLKNWVITRIRIWWTLRLRKRSEAPYQLRLA